MAKKKVVTKEQLKKSGYDNLRDYMNAFKFDDDKNKYVKREKALTRREVKPVNVKPVDNKPKIIKDSSSNKANYFDNRASTRSSYSPTDRSTKSDSSRVKGAKNLVTEDKKRGGNPVFGFKKGGYGKFNMDDKSFGEAFKKYKADGRKTFTYKGKQYTTQTKEEVKKSKPKSKRADAPNMDPNAKSTANTKRADRLNMMGERNTRPKRADASNMDPNAKSTKLNPLISEIKKSIEKSGRNFPVKKKKMKAGGPVKFKRGGRIDGIAKKGKTKGTLR